MNNLQNRLNSLSPERRRLLEQLNADRAVRSRAGARPTEIPLSTDAPLPPAAEAAALVSAMVPDDGEPTPGDHKTRMRQFYDAISRQLAAANLDAYATFLNLGYADDGSPGASPVALPRHVLNRNSVRLVLEVIGDCDLTRRSVLDVGCGRGGTTDVIERYFTPQRVVGLDLSFQAIGSCQARNRSRRRRFLQGDSEHLPFRDGAFDAITNVESSCSYADVFSFYAEVYRLLQPGGHFLYTDYFPTDDFPARLTFLKDQGLVEEINRDITNNVLLSCDELSATRVTTFDSNNDRKTMQDFLAVPGSGPYEAMRRGEATYRILRLRKP